MKGGIRDGYRERYKALQSNSFNFRELCDVLRWLPVSQNRNMCPAYREDGVPKSGSPTHQRNALECIAGDAFQCNGIIKANSIID